MKQPTGSKAKVNTVSLDDIMKKVDEVPVKTVDTSDLSQSPLNNSPTVEKDYTHQAAPQAQAPKPEPVAQPAQSSPQPQMQQPAADPNSYFMPEPDPSAYAHMPDVPEQNISTPQGNLPQAPAGAGPQMDQQGEGSENIDKMMEEGADSLATTILTMYKSAVPEIEHQISKIKTRELKKEVQLGNIPVTVIEEIDTRNKENLAAFKARATEDVKMMDRPLKKLLIKKGIQAPPHIELMIVAVFVVIMNVFLIMSVKKDNESMMNRISAMIRRKKEDDSVPLVHAETVGEESKK